MNQEELTQKLKNNDRIFGLGSVLYACFYAFCLYKNNSGVTYPFFLIGSLLFFCYCMKKLGISLKKDSLFYMVAIILLGVSTFCTGDGRIIAMNNMGIFLLMASFLLHAFFQDHNWSFFRYFKNIFVLAFSWLGQLHRPFQDFRKKENEKNTGFFILIGLCAGIPLLAIVWMLLSSADAAFYQMSARLFDKINLADIIGITFTIVLVFFAVYGTFAFLCCKKLTDEVQDKKSAEALPFIVVLVPLTVLYMVFCGVQIVCLFGGSVELEGMTYAQYARKGFFDLLVVCILNLILVQVGHGCFRKNTALNVVMTVMSACTYIMIASSAFRMIQYIRHYYLTFLRILVLWALIVIAILLTGVIISIFKEGFPLFRFMCVIVTVGYLLLSFSHVDYWIAKCNMTYVNHTENTFFDTDGRLDFRYLAKLSSDAAPALSEGIKLQKTESAGAENPDYVFDRYDGINEENWGQFYLDRMDEQYENMQIRSFNLSKYIAHKVLN